MDQLDLSQALGLPAAQPVANLLLPRRVYNDNTGVDLTEFHYFKKIPVELRNMIYKLVLSSNRVIQICSPIRKNFRNNTNFASILLTDSQIYDEAIGYYYRLNRFAVGNNYFRRTYLANIDGLHKFMRVSRKEHLAKIKEIEINICANRIGPWYEHKAKYGRSLKSICLILLKHFRGLEKIIIKACALGDRPFTSTPPGAAPTIIQRGDWTVAGDALRMLLDGNMKGTRGLPGLKVERFRWYQANNIRWMEMPDRPVNKENDPLKSFAGYVEGDRPHLRNQDGLWVPLRVSRPSPV